MADDPCARIAQLEAGNAALQSIVAGAAAREAATAEVLRVVAASPKNVNQALDAYL